MSFVYGGFRGKVRWVPEDSYGIVPSGSSGSYIGLVDSFEPRLSMGNIFLRQIGHRDLVGIQRGRFESSASIEYMAQDHELLRYALEKITGSFTLEARWTSTDEGASPSYFIMSGCKINSARVSNSVGNAVRVVLDVWGRSGSFSGSNYLSGSVFTEPPHSIPMMWHDSSIKINGSTVNNLNAFEYNIRNDLERLYFVEVSGRYPRIIPEKARTWEGTVTMTFDSITELDRMLSASDFTLDVIESGSFSGSFYGCRWNESALPTRPTDLIMLRIPWTARSGSLWN